MMIKVASISFYHKTASCIVHEEDSGRYGRLVNLYSHERGQGHATELMTQICDWADSREMVLYLEAHQYGDPRGLTNVQLIEFYKKFGFKVEDWDRTPVIMERHLLKGDSYA